MNEAGNDSSISVLGLPLASTLVDQQEYDAGENDTITVDLYMVMQVEDKTIYCKVDSQTIPMGIPYTFKGLRAANYVVAGATDSEDLYVSYEFNPVNVPSVNVKQTNPVKNWIDVAAAPIQAKVIDPSVDYTVNPMADPNQNGSIQGNI